MNYKKRSLESKLKLYKENFPCVLVSGSRQVGKSTLIEHLFSPGAKMFTFDPLQDLFGEKSDPDLFLLNNPPPLILDEIQYVPQLVPSLKRFVDRNRHPGMYLITGSQQWEVMRHLSESMAGRIAVLELSPFSLPELAGAAEKPWFAEWLQTSVAGRPDEADQRLLSGTGGVEPLIPQIWRGMFPEVQSLDEQAVPGWMRGYMATYLQRDVRSFLQVQDERQFALFMGLCAALTARECNYSQLGREIGLSAPGASKWLNVLRGGFQWLEIPAFSNNQIKKLSQRPKGYLTDTGLICHLLRIPSPEALPANPAFGSVFETFSVLEIVKQIQTLSSLPALYHYRQHSGAEVDLIVELNGKYFPLEFKASSRVRPADAAGMDIFREKHGDRVGTGLILYAGRESVRLNSKTLAVPVQWFGQ
jgi:uncharacterized protein